MKPFQQQHEDSEEAYKRREAIFDATTAARGRAKELGVSLALIEGTGSNGRVTRDDVEAHVAKRARAGGQAPVVPGASQPSPVVVEPEPVADGAGRVRFHCSTNPDFNLQSRKLGKTIYFTEGCYETSDLTEIAVLRACQFVEEVSG